ncbi:MarR family winged helix-turn-helix transcriptional regulator [Gordonia sp. DT30]|uniref:MarR family winged helix-turn-helix transcriptional regulator n=1 Tax=Gordonia sp. DT30 TaxID=3416546 RepID=UPI003CFA256A
MSERESLNRSTATAVRVAVSMIKRRTRETFADNELSAPELSALSQIDRTGPTAIAELARSTRITPQSMGATVAALERLHLVSRDPDPADKRRSLLTVTDAGRDVVHSGRDSVTEKMATALANSFTDDEVATLAAAAPLLERLAQLF